MPLWLDKFRRRKPPPRPEPQERAATSVRDLSDSLCTAITAGNINEARRIIDTAFWENTGFRPDGFHLLMAVQDGDREMVKLIATHGAKWSDAEACIACAHTDPEKWKGVEGVLRHAGMRTTFTEEELKKTDPFAAAAWNRRLLQQAERHGDSARVAAAKLALDKAVLGGALTLVIDGRHEGAKIAELLRLRSTERGDGTAARPFVLEAEIDAIATVTRGRPALALKFLDDLKAAGLQVRPLALSGTALWLNPGVMEGLEARGLLNPAQAEDRLGLLSKWSLLQESFDWNGHTLNIGADYVAQQHAALQRVARILFTPGLPAGAAEAEAFVKLSEDRAKRAPAAMARMDDALVQLGYFDSADFTPAHFARLAAAAPSPGLRATFNRRALSAQIRPGEIKEFLNPSKFDTLLEAHRAGAFRATGGDAAQIVDYLAKQVKKDVVPEAVAEAVKTLKAGGADFSALDPNRYIGKRAPGLAKTLLDAGAVAASSFDLDAYAKRHDSKINLITPPSDAAYRDTEFLCQLMLEITAPDRFVPLRGKPDTDYQKHFLREIVTSKQLRRVIKYSPPKKSGARPPRPPSPW